MTPWSHLFIFSNTYFTSRVTRQNDRICLWKIIIFEIKWNNILKHLESDFQPAKGDFKVNIWDKIQIVV